MLRGILAWLIIIPVIGSVGGRVAHAGGGHAAAAAAGGGASSVAGKLELPPTLPDRPPMAVKGFLDRTENPLAPLRPVTPTSQMIVVLEGGETAVSPPQVVVELLGESFSRKVVAAPAGAEVVIKNMSKTARSLVAAEDPKLIPQGPINPTGPKSFRIETAGKVYTIGDKDAPHLVLKLVTVPTTYFAYPDESGHFSIDNVPAGNYKLKIWYGNGWLDRPDDAVEVSGKGKTEFNPKIAAGAFAPSAAKK